jgi:nuclear pore complex protein Nup205
LADTLEVDQVEAAQYLYWGIQEAQSLDRSGLECAIIRFHEYRSFLAEFLRLAFQLSLDDEFDPAFREVMQNLVKFIFGTKTTASSDGSNFARKCMATMLDIEDWLNRIAEEVQKWQTLSQTASPAAEEAMGIQQQNLTQQHESIGTILTCIVKGNYAKIEDFRVVLEQAAKVDKWNVLAVHYAPVLIEFCAHYGSTAGNVSFDEAQALHRSIVASIDSKPWPLRNFHAAFVTWWLAEYSSWFVDQPAAASLSPEEQEREADARSATLTRALRDGAFQCTLSMCSQIKPSDWYDPSRINLIRSLLNDAPVLPFEPASINTYFQEVAMEHFDSFTEAFIANMPDTLRQFKAEGDDQRRRLLAGVQSKGHNGAAEYDRHLERFFVIMSYVYEDRPEAALGIWEDSDGYMYGFLQWFSRKVSTPLMGAFCEMFRSISMGETAAGLAHTFLLDEAPVSASRIRRAACLSWVQMFEELEFYANKVKDGHSATQSSISALNGKPKPVDVDEPETPVMLECYLRLISHLCAQSSIVRQWVWTHPTFRLVDVLFLLCSSTVPSSIRSSTYACLRGLLKVDRVEVHEAIWVSLDQWISNGFVERSNIPRPTKIGNTSAWAEELTFEAISNDIEEADSFTCLLQALFSLPSNIGDLKDALSFPEQLGGTYRMAGVEPYIDLVMGKIFANKVPHLERSRKQHALASNVLHLVQTCLQSFNENLIVLAHRSGKNVDELIRASSLLNYILLHPFARVIEWLFNEKVLNALFTVAHQDITEINNAQVNSPLVLSLLRSISVMNLVMDLQATYLDIVRPQVKIQSKGRRQAVINPSLVSFEDSISANLRIVVDLAYYSGSGHEDLALASMELLKKFSMSRKLNVAQPSKFGTRVMINRLVGAVQQHDDVEPIARSMSQTMEFDENELALGADSPGFNIKFAILDFLEKTLATHPERPNMAHALLGFDCTGAFVRVENNSLFAQKQSLFHAIVKLSLEYPSALDGSMQYWMLSIKQKAVDIIRFLWSSKLTSDIVLSELRLLRVMFYQFIEHGPIDADTLWEQITMRDPSFVYLDGAKALVLYLRSRKALYAYSAAALRRAVSEDVALLKAQITSTILGSTITEDIEQPNMSIFDHLDFMELGTHESPAGDALAAVGIDDTRIVEDPESKDGRSFDLKLAEQLISLERNRQRRQGALPDEAAEINFDLQRREALATLNGSNNYIEFVNSRLDALRAWADVVTVLIQNTGLEADDRTALALQALSVISPKLELFAAVNSPEALVFARLVQTLLSQLDFKSSALEAGSTSDVPHDKLFQLFKISLAVIADPSTSMPLRESLYNIAYRYLVCVFDSTNTQYNPPSDSMSASTALSAPSIAPHRLSYQTVKNAGDALIDTISDDAYGDDNTTRIAALLLLDALTRLANTDNSKYLVENLVRTNFIVVLVERMREMPSELRDAGHTEIPILLSYYKSILTLLLTLSQSRLGATHVLNAGLFSSIKSSGLFATDPDIGLDVENPDAILRYYELLLHVLRVVLAVVLARGSQNLQTIEAARTFLSEGRLLMVGVLKREARIGAKNEAADQEVRTILRELVEIYVLLVSVTGFLEVRQLH